MNNPELEALLADLREFCAEWSRHTRPWNLLNNDLQKIIAKHTPPEPDYTSTDWWPVL